MTMLATKPNVLRGKLQACAVAGHGKVPSPLGLGGLLDLLWRQSDLMDDVLAMTSHVEDAVGDLETPGCPMNMGLALLGVLRKKQLNLAAALASNNLEIRTFLAE